VIRALLVSLQPLALGQGPIVCALGAGRGRGVRMLAVKEALRVKLSVRCTPVPQLLTLNDKEDERMRDASFATMREMGVGTAGSAEAACVDG
jgi:hypothetical protein